MGFTRNLNLRRNQKSVHPESWPLNLAIVLKVKKLMLDPGDAGTRGVHTAEILVFRVLQSQFGL
jgi:hypothetical protein